MKKHRNHEGYHDPTAGKAIGRAGKKKPIRDKEPLSIRLAQLPAFQEAVKEIKDNIRSALHGSGKYDQ